MGENDMCGRFVRGSSISEIADEFNADYTGIDIKPSYNITPGQNIVLVTGQGGKNIVLCKWGFIPSWSKDPSIGNRMINARSETVAEKTAFRGAFRKQRCLIAANGFYEWRKTGSGKTPVYISLRNRGIFGFAGLYSTWISPERRKICTTTILTTNANKVLKNIHDRMPVIISRENESIWLDYTIADKEALEPLLKPYPSEEIRLTEVSKYVNSPRNDSSDCIKPI
jgi:putative SOS response-associated peptidase YedK